MSKTITFFGPGEKHVEITPEGWRAWTGDWSQGPKDLNFITGPGDGLRFAIRDLVTPVPGSDDAEVLARLVGYAALLGSEYGAHAESCVASGVRGAVMQSRD